MTTTPDYRTRADWTLPAETAAPPPTVAPDTSTIAGKVRVMDASARGESVQQRAIAPFVNATNCDWAAHDGEWNWSVFDYRIAPPPAHRTALQRARDVIRHRPAVHNPDSLAMMALVSEIDIAPAVWFGAALLDQCGITGATPGRYRLVRDDD